ncbi:MAG TPA: hypothetical protein VF399_00315 [bacterium]
MKVAGYIKVTIVFEQLPDRWTVQCVELGTATFGKTLEDAKAKIMDAILCHLNTLDELGETEYFFKKHGIKYYEQKPKEKRETVTTSLSDNILVQKRLQRIPVFAHAHA